MNGGLAQRYVLMTQVAGLAAAITLLDQVVKAIALERLAPDVAIEVIGGLAIRALSTGGWADRSAIGLILGGAVGNLIDRARFGAVVDFIDLYWRAYHWPVFNVADAAITVGVVVLAARMMGK